MKAILTDLIAFCCRVRKAWRFYRRLRYSWRLSWAKAQ